MPLCATIGAGSFSRRKRGEGVTPREKETGMNRDTAMALAKLVSGLELAIIHIFNCLDAKGVMSRPEAIQSLEETIRFLPPDQQHGPMHMVLRGIVQGLRMQGQAAPDARPRIADLLRVIEGGMSETPDTTPRE